EEQLRLYRDHVAVRGAGVLWVGGPYQTPTSYGSSPLADLLPMVEPTSVTALGAGVTPVAIRPTSEARALSILEIDDAGGDGAEASADTKWPSDLPEFHWVQDLGRLKPAAEALAMTVGRTGS